MNRVLEKISLFSKRQKFFKLNEACHLFNDYATRRKRHIGLLLLAAAASACKSASELQCDSNKNSEKINDVQHKRILEHIVLMKEEHPDNIMASAFTMEYFNSLSEDLKVRFLKCCAPEAFKSECGLSCYATMPDDYDTFKPFFRKVVENYHKVDMDKVKPGNNWCLSEIEGIPENWLLDFVKFGLSDVSMHVQVRRNLQRFPLPALMNRQDKIDLELTMQKLFKKLIAVPRFGGQYVSLTPGHKNFLCQEEHKRFLQSYAIVMDATDQHALCAHPVNQFSDVLGYYISEDKSLVISVGQEDHLQIMCVKRGTCLNDIVDFVQTAVDTIDELVPGGYAYSNDFGFVTSSPANVGTGMCASVSLRLPNLTGNRTVTGAVAKVKAIAKHFGLGLNVLGGEHVPKQADEETKMLGGAETVEISVPASFGTSEAEMVTTLYRCIKVLMAKENAAGAKPADAQLLEIQASLLCAEQSFLEFGKQLKLETKPVEQVSLELQKVQNQLNVVQRILVGVKKQVEMDATQLRLVNVLEIQEELLRIQKCMVEVQKKLTFSSACTIQ